MSICCFFLIMFLVLSGLALAIECSPWILAVLFGSTIVFAFSALEQFDKLEKRIDELERKLKQQKDGADNE